MPACLEQSNKSEPPMFKPSSECPSRAGGCKNPCFAAFVFAACLAVFFASPGLAAVITVAPGETVFGPVLGTPQADEITVEAGGEVKEFVSGEGGDDVVVNNGTVGWYMLGFELGEGGSPTVINNGLIKEDLLGTVDSRDNNTRAVVENHGTVEGLMIGGFASRGRFIVKNSGTVLWDLYGLASDFYIYQRPGQEFKVEIYNSGTVHGYIFGNFLDNGKVFIENTGTVMLDIYGTTLSLSDSVIVNKGTVLGSIYGGFGTDIVTLVGGCSVGGVVDGFFGHDTLILDNMGLQHGSLWGSKYIDFENLSFTGADNRLAGSWQLGDVPLAVYGGYLTLLSGASLYAASLDVQTGGTASLLGQGLFCRRRHNKREPDHPGLFFHRQARCRFRRIGRALRRFQDFRRHRKCGQPVGGRRFKRGPCGVCGHAQGKRGFDQPGGGNNPKRRTLRLGQDKGQRGQQRRHKPGQLGRGFDHRGRLHPQPNRGDGHRGRGRRPNRPALRDRQGLPKRRRP